MPCHVLILFEGEEGKKRNKSKDLIVVFNLDQKVERERERI
jgi:hypothetical protein